jgi:hypothetical protein
MQKPAMFLNNSRRDGQAQPGTAIFGGEEGVKQPLLNLPGNTFARIRDG